ncbi:MAG TPA: DNA-binding protein WhiA [Anaerolineae bacterium]|nr:DNA-binding protein WhiA [Anaerolineae bacterium]
MADSRERELVQAIRAELAAIDPPRACCRAAERVGLGAAARGHARSPVVARLAVRLDAGEAETSAGAPSGFDWALARDHCRAAWLRGRFLAAGSLSLGARGAHLELVVPLDEAEELRERLEQAGFELSLRERRGRGVITSKRTETILSLLRTCGAGASVLEIEARLVMRQLQGHLNRVLNAETANLERSVASSARQLALIKRLESDGRLGELSALDQAVAVARKSAPEASFSELARGLGLSRARVQRAFERIESKADATVPAGDL